MVRPIMLIQKSRQDFRVLWLDCILMSNRVMSHCKLNINFGLTLHSLDHLSTCPVFESPMGRKAKYITSEEKTAAARRHKALYAQSER